MRLTPVSSADFAAVSPRQRKPLARNRLRPADIRRFVEELVADDMHAKRVLSLGNAVAGTIHAATLSVHAIGQGLALAQGLTPKHAVKQVDRLLSNQGVSLDIFFANWVPFVIGPRPEAFLALDWTEFDADDHATIALYLITSHGRATPLLWKTVAKSTLEGWRNAHEDELLECFARLRPESVVRAIVLADRGFGDQALYTFLASLKLDFIIRFRAGIQVESADGLVMAAGDWTPLSGRARRIPKALVTTARTPVAAVVCVQARGMKDAWCLATSRGDLTGPQVVKEYGKRFRIEETFRDSKDLRFGMGLRATHIGQPGRRDRLLMLAAMAHALMTLLGAAAEEVGLDRKLRANTAKHRTHSLFRQGCYWYAAIPTMPDEWLAPLMAAFQRIVTAQATFTQVFGVL